MRRLLVGVTGEVNDIAIELEEQDAALIGREPTTDGIASVFPDGSASLRPVSLGLPSVSANHIAVRSTAQGVTIVDVGSRHGSWLRLPLQRPVHVDTTSAIHLRLGEASTGGPSLPSPSAAEWTDHRDYGASLVTALQAWLADLAIPARVRLAQRERQGDSADHPGRIPLAPGGELLVVPLQTMDARWHVALQRIWQYIQNENSRFASEHATRAEGVVLASAAIRRVHRQVIEAAQRGARLMLVGPSGAGKEALARVFHRHTGSNGAFVPRSCAELTHELARVELFGAEPGAFMGASRRIVGAVERADGGTLFLDELGEMPADVQPMLLRFLDRGEFERLGDDQAPRTASVHIVGAAHRDLHESVARSEFRSDLWYRLSNEVIELPPLRERFDDVRAFLRGRQATGGGTALDLISEDAEAVLRAHRWDGNFRELDSFAARLVATANGPIDALTCRDLLARGSAPARPAPRPAAPDRLDPADRARPELWTRLIERAAAAFTDDVGHATPESWDEVTEFTEKYFKPLLFAHLADSSPGSPEDEELRALARRLDVDCGTASKQLQRYFGRFAR